MDRRTFGQLLIGASALGVNEASVARTKSVAETRSAKLNTATEIEREQAYLTLLRDGLNSLQINPYGAAYVPGTRELIDLSKARLCRLRASYNKL